jgi:hypothetical protein
MKKYLYRHKPTQKWVYLKLSTPSGEFEQYGSYYEIELVDNIMNTDWYSDISILKDNLLTASLNGVKDYGRDNFLEFELYSVKVEYICEPVENI